MNSCFLHMYHAAINEYNMASSSTCDEFSPSYCFLFPQADLELCGLNSYRQKWKLQKCVLAKEELHRFLHFKPNTSDNQNPIPLHTSSPPNMFWQAVSCKQRFFLEQLSCRIFIVWLMFLWEITTSVSSIGEAQQSGGYFPLSPQIRAFQSCLINAQICWSVDEYFISCLLSLKLNSHKNLT